MCEWKECVLSKVAKFGNGKRKPKSEGDIPIFGGNGILGYSSESNYDGETIIIGRVGAYSGSVYYQNKPVWVSDNALAAKPKEGNNTKFLYYFLKNMDLNQFAGGSSHPLVTQTLLNSLEIKISNDEKEQKAIASVLSSLDDKIDLLHRQNKTLEATAETLFRQWFVEEADEGWEEVDLDYVTQRITDGAHKSPPTVDVGLPMASVKDMHQWGIHHDSCKKISETDYVELVRNDCRPLKDDIIIAKDGSYLKHVFVAPNDLDLVILSSIAILRPNGKYNPLLLSIYLKMNSTREALENIVTGAVIPRIVLKDFRKFKLTLPPMKLQIKALKTLEPIYMKCWENVNQIYTLEKLRDTLLPKLMSGEVRAKLEQQEAGI
ncbi:MAG: restriction endonuclease subunit S [Euryarchaeota archaeon]|nr:restriction endonuclease subunit S [Euryarchaeota archaeon]